LRRGERAARQINGLHDHIGPRRLVDKREDYGQRRRKNKGSRNGETEANRALIVSGGRRIPCRRTFAGRAWNGPYQAQSSNVPRASFMDMSDRKPELQSQSEQCKPRAEAVS
jgi:hypothetical protein